MVIQHNMTAMNSNRQFGITTGARAQSAEKLSSGYKINRAADDAAGLAISEKMRRQIRGLTQAEDNVQDGISYVQVADGALAEIDDILARMTELCVKAATESLTTEDREYIDAEIQKLKAESNRTFHTTTFNEKLIWDENTTDRKQIGTEKRNLITWGRTSGQKTDITSVNKGVWPVSSFGFDVSGDSKTVKLKWTGYDGVNYESKPFDIPDLETLKRDGFSMPINDSTMDYNTYPNAVGIEPAISMTIDDEATREQFINRLKTYTISSGLTYGISPTFKMAADYSPSPYVSLSTGGHISYLAGLVSGKALSGTDNNHIKTMPVSGLNRSTPEQFDYVVSKDANTLPAGGTFNASIKFTGNVSVWSEDRRPETEGIWWEYTQDKKDTYGKGYGYDSSAIATSLDNITSESGLNNILTNSSKTSHIQLSFNIKNEEAVRYSYDNGDGTRKDGSSLTDMGDFYLTIDVRPGATAADVKGIINAIQGIQIGTAEGTKMGLGYYSSEYDGPVYGGTMALEIQAGADGTQDNRIPIIYDVLNNHSLKISDLNTLTVESSQKGLSQVKNAAQIVDEQRSVFGAYQNRLEHTYNNLGNVVENTQSAESIIRDTDMAAEMVRFSNLNILAQAGQSMMAQANQTNQGVLSLLQ